MPPTRRPHETAAAFVEHFGTQQVTYAEAIAAGFSRQQQRSALRRGTLIRVRRGVIAAPAASPGSSAPSSASAVAPPVSSSVASRLLADGAIASLHGAAVAHGLPTPSGPSSGPILIRPGASGGRRGGYRVRGSDVPPHRLTTIDGCLVTSLERTAIDLARGQPFPAALVPLDAALRRIVAQQQGVSGPELRYAVLDAAARSQAGEALSECLEELRGWPGVVAVRTALPYADPAAESASESVSRGWLLEAGETGLVVGHPLRVGGTTFWADLADLEGKLVFEVDGWSKYVGAPDAVRREIQRERDRQRRLESVGWTFRRWALSDGRYTVVDLVRQARSRARAPGQAEVVVA
jgi:hypothetical protein